MSSRVSGINHSFLTIVVVLLSLLTSSFVFAVPQQETPRKIVSDDFTKNRQNAGSTSKAAPGNAAGAIQSKPFRRSYRLASQPVNSVRASATENVMAQLGVTLWKLRPAGAGDGARALVREKGKPQWIAERVEGDAMFREGDHVRLSVESQHAGYLYVVNRDTFADGTIGDAMLIYPWTGIDNQVSPGRLVDIPAQDDEPSYFTARLTSANQIGELLTFIVTTSPLDLPIADNPIKIANAQIANWEKTWGGESERFELEGGAGEVWTIEEQQAAAKKGARQLTRNDPVPQTIYRVSTRNKNALLVNVRLRYAK